MIIKTSSSASRGSPATGIGAKQGALIRWPRDIPDGQFAGLVQRSSVVSEICPNVGVKSTTEHHPIV